MMELLVRLLLILALLLWLGAATWSTLWMIAYGEAQGWSAGGG